MASQRAAIRLVPLAGWKSLISWGRNLRAALLFRSSLSKETIHPWKQTQPRRARRGDRAGRGPGSAGKLLFSGMRTPTGEMSMGLAEIEPGGKVPLHRHAPAEIYHVRDGEGELRSEMSSTLSVRGMATFIPPNAWHDTEGTGAQPMRFLLLFAAESFDDVHYEFADDG